MSQNQNLFYNLYSKSNNVTSAGYTCRNAVDEHDTSFDIIGQAGVISDSNGKELASIDMSIIHAADLTQYNVETKILQPGACCLLQGQELGLSCASFYYNIPEKIVETQNYEKFVEIDFDIVFNNICPKSFHVSTKADGENSFIEQINEDLNTAGIDVRTSLQQIRDPKTNKINEYLVFLSQVEGFFYIILNCKLTPIFQSEDYPYSPFSKEISGIKGTIHDLIIQYHPVKIGQKYDPITYEVDCDLYTWLLYNYQDAVSTLLNFENALELIRKIQTEEHTQEEIQEMIQEIKELLKDTPYDSQIIDNYNYTNLVAIKNIIESVKSMLTTLQTYYQEFYWLKEDLSKRIPVTKYPNGAFRGLVIVPEWPVNDASKYENASLWINHVVDDVTLYIPTQDGKYIPKKYHVVANALLNDEYLKFRKNNCIFGNITCSGNSVNVINEGWNDILHVQNNNCSCCKNDDIECECNGQNCHATKKTTIGLFRYLRYVDDNNLWTKMGQAYMIVNNPDDPQSRTKNLSNSLLIGNPNDFPIKIKYLEFT